MAEQRGILGVDIDGVLADSDVLYRQLIEDWYGIKLAREQVLRPNYFEFAGVDDPEAEIQNFFKRVSKENLWQQIQPLPEAKEALRTLKQKGYTIFILTSRPPIEPIRSETLRWLERYDMVYDEIYFIWDGKKYELVREKGLALNFFIEDFVEYAIDFAENGVPVLLFDYPWNRHLQHPNIIRVSSWSEALRILLEG